MDPRVATGAAPVLMQHQIGRLGQAVLLDAPPLFKMFWRTISPLLDRATASRFQFLTPHDKDDYFSQFLTPAQARFMKEILETRAVPGSFPPCLAPHARSPFRIELSTPCRSERHGGCGGACQQGEAVLAAPLARERRPPACASKDEMAEMAVNQSAMGALCGSLGRCLPVRA